MRRLARIISWAAGILVVLVALLGIVVWSTTLQPAPVQAEPVSCRPDMEIPVIQPGQSLKLLTYNVQYMAGKGYVFFYDMPGDAGPDDRPSPESITHTLEEVARVIADENPDLVLLQEVDDGAKRTDYEDQMARLVRLLPDGDYPCSATAFYWKAAYVPHPHINGSVGMKLVTLSKYRISEATRYQLALVPDDPLTQQFNLKRAVLQTRLPASQGKDVMILNTHLEAFAQGTNTMEQQVAEVAALLDRLTQEGHAWAIGGDFNLVPPGDAYSRLADDQKAYYKEKSELSVLYDTYQAVPSLADVTGENAAAWYTHFPNNPAYTAPNKTIDYFFLSNNITVNHAYVRQHDTLDISDHLPVIAEVTLPGQ